MYFNLICNLSIPKETDNFKPYKLSTSQKGWTTKNLKLNAKCGTNRVMLSLTAGHGENSLAYYFEKTESGKSKNVNVPFADRKRVDMSTVAEFAKYKVDFGDAILRRKLHNIIKKNKNKEVFKDSDFEDTGFTIESDFKEIESKLKELNALKHEYISQWDYIDVIKDAIENGDYEKTKFRITGNVECQYSEKNGRWYINYVPNNIWIVPDDTPYEATINGKLLLTDESIEDYETVSEGRVIEVKGYSMEYYRPAKKNLPMEVTFKVDTENEKKANLVKKLLTVKYSDTVGEIGVVLNILDGPQVKQITEDDLDEEQKEMIEMGLMTMKDIIQEMGGSIYGDVVREFRLAKIVKGYSKGVNTEDIAYTPEDLVLSLASESAFEDSENEKTETEEDKFDLFTEDDLDDDNLV